MLALCMYNIIKNCVSPSPSIHPVHTVTNSRTFRAVDIAWSQTTRCFGSIGLHQWKQLQLHIWNVPFIHPVLSPLLEMFPIFSTSHIAMSHYNITPCTYLQYNIVCLAPVCTTRWHYTSILYISERQWLCWSSYTFIYSNAWAMVYHWCARAEINIFSTQHQVLVSCSDRHLCRYSFSYDFDNTSLKLCFQLAQQVVKRLTLKDQPTSSTHVKRREAVGYLTSDNSLWKSYNMCTCIDKVNSGCLCMYSQVGGKWEDSAFMHLFMHTHVVSHCMWFIHCLYMLQLCMCMCIYMYNILNCVTSSLSIHPVYMLLHVANLVTIN